MINKKDEVRSFITSRLGSPVVALCDNEDKAIDDAVIHASTEYWTALPYIKTHHILTSLNCSEIVLPVSDLKDLFFTNQEVKDSAYFLGIIRYDCVGRHHINSPYYNTFDVKLLGTKANSFNSLPLEDPRYINDQILRNSTNEDILFGELDYRYDQIEDNLLFTTPAYEGNIQLWIGWGFCSEKTIGYVPMNHFVTFKKLVALHFLEIVLSSRNSITFADADYQMETTELENKRDNLREEVSKEMSELSFSAMTWG